MAKTQPKVSEIVEILLHQVVDLEKSVKQNNQTQNQLSKKLDTANIKVDISELILVQETIRERLQSDFENFYHQTKKNNMELLKVHKAISSKKLFYLVFLTVLLLLTTGVSVYIAIKKSITKTNYELITNENNFLNNKIETFELFLIENPEVIKKYEKWNKYTSK